MDKFKNKYRVQSTRLQNWNYGWNASYFVTICTANRICYFGNITNGEMHLSELGQQAVNCWLEIPAHFPFVILDRFIIMPNHVHGIIIINKPVETQNFASLQMSNISPNHAVNPHAVKRQNFASLQSPSVPQNQFAPQSQNLASIVRGFKIGVTKQAKQMQINFAWQPRFYDHIIRNQESYLKIAEYTETNPQRWQEDRFYLQR